MPKLRCHMVCRSNSSHLAQVFTGFTLLARQNRIELSQDCQPKVVPDTTRPEHLQDANVALLFVTINGSKRLCYDAHDSFEIDMDVIDHVDLYFKRSYAPASIPERYQNKVLPLGLNYAVYADGLDRFEMQRTLAYYSGTDKWIRVARLMAEGVGISPVFRATPKHMQAPPMPDQEPKVLYMVRTFRPSSDPQRSQEKKEQRERLNEMRARCIMLLREQFGAAFLGGFAHDEYSKANYKHALLHDPALAGKATYIKLLRTFPICVASTGLHGSIGWKMAEYVAYSKAIVSEKLNYNVPGNFARNEHYLEFSTPEQCVEAATQLVADRELRNQIMQNNYQYYNAFLRPDALVMNTLDIAVSG